MGMPAEVFEEIFTVIEGGQSIGTSAEVIQFPSDNGLQTFTAVNKTYQGTNGVGLNYWVAAVTQGASAISAGALMISCTIPEFLALAVPCLGIAVGTAFYNIDPEGWTNLAGLLYDAGWTIKNKVVAFMTENGIINVAPEVLEILSDELNRLGAFPSADYGDLPDLHDELTNDAFTKMSVNEWISTFRIPVRSDDYYYNEYKDCNGYLMNTVYNNAYPRLYVNHSALDYEIVSEGPYDVTSVSEIQNYAAISPSVEFPQVGTYRILGFENTGLYPASTTSGNHINNVTNIPNSGGVSLLSNVDINKGVPTQEGAKFPESGQPIAPQYPEWIPFEFPDLQGWQIPEVFPMQYPNLLPTESENYQHEAQDPNIDTGEQEDEGLKKIQDPRSDITIREQEDEKPEKDDDESDEEEEIDDGETDDPVPPDPINPDPGTPITPVIPVGNLPTTVGSNKLFTVYNPSSSQLDALGGYLWDDDLIDILRKIWQNPLDGIISLIQVYCTPVTGASHNIILGYLDSGVSAPVVTNQFVTIDCGEVTIPEQKQNATDYNPFTSMELYLPFIGITEIDTNEFMNGSIKVKYHIDVYTGTCLAEVTMTRNSDVPNGAVVYTFSGNCSQQLPLTSGDAKGVLSALLSAAGVGIGIAAGGASVGMKVAAGLKTAGDMVSHEMLHVSHSGNLSANAGIMGQKKPYVIISRKNPYTANNYNKLYGFPCNKTVYLGNCFGYVRVKAGRLRSLATQDEKNEIMNFLSEGVIM